MRKIILIFLLQIFFLTGLVPFFITQEAFAQKISCEVKTEPSPVTTTDRTIKLTIESSDLGEGRDYWVELAGLNNYVIQESVVAGGKKFQVTKGIITIENLSQRGVQNPPSNYQETFQIRTYFVKVQEPKVGGQEICQDSFPVYQARAGGAGCTVEFLNETFTSKDNVSFKLTNLTTTDQNLDVVVKEGGPAGSEVGRYQNSVSQLRGDGANIKTFDRGYYYLGIEGGGFWGLRKETLCHAIFPICPTCTKELITGRRGPPPEAPPPPCLEGKNIKEEITTVRSEIVECTKLDTAVGGIPTDPAGLVTFVLRLILYLSGGIALILIIVGGYQMMTSQGNPEKLQGAKETITSAIVGLLFIIFSLVLLEVIGVDILRIPGFIR